MAGRLAIQKFSSGIARSRSLLSAAADASSSATSGLAARYFSTFSCSPAAHKTSWITTGMPSTTLNPVRLSSTDSVRGSTQSLLSSACRSPTIAQHAANLNKTTTTIMGLATCIGLMLMGTFDPKPSDDRRHSHNHNQKNGLRRHCPTCSCKSPARGDSKS